MLVFEWYEEIINKHCTLYSVHVSQRIIPNDTVSE